jgi:DUF438 domain-containing protein
MSELIKNSGQRMDDLVAFARGIIRGGEGRSLFETYRPVLDTVTPGEAMQVLDRLLTEGIPLETVKAATGKLINTFYKSLSGHSWEKPGPGHFLSCLMQENREAEKITTEIKSVLKALFVLGEPAGDGMGRLRQLVGELKKYELHYIKKENILFPFVEKVFPHYRCLQLMWSFHDDFRKSIKSLERILLTETPDREELTREMGKLFFVVLPVIFREEQIVFPVAYRAIPPGEWEEMLRQSLETGWCYIAPPVVGMLSGLPGERSGDRINLGSGQLTPDQLVLLFSHLPVDITFVDENDEVCFFSEVPHRIFPRSRAIIGRKVQNCHPPESVHLVNEIVDAFRRGERDVADFWIQMRGRFILIRYFALRDSAGNYRGTIEVSQDATEIRKLEGERRLL